MKPTLQHSWDLSETQAFELQQELSKKVVTSDDFDEINFVAGVSITYQKYGNKLVAGVVVFDAKTLEIVETVTADNASQFPYIPDLFSFRELPPVISAFEQLEHSPDLVICNGQGLAHPKRFGLACHLGVIFDIPSIGCGKSRLLGEAEVPKDERGSTSALRIDDEIIGNSLRTQVDVKPIDVSIGHRISLETACQWVLTFAPNYRLPETTRFADKAVKNAMK